MLKRTKIICTIGPASEKIPALSAMMKNGMNIARLNFSHGTHANHKALIKNIRAAARKNKQTVGIMADLQGPKIRAGELGEAGVEFKNGETVVLTASRLSFPRPVPRSAKGEVGKRESSLLKIPVTYAGLPRDVKPGERLLLDDGLMELRVLRVKGKDVFCKVINGGKLLSHKGINLPDSKIRLSSLTAKDKDDLAFAMGERADFVAISFVRRAKDIKELQGLINKNSKKSRFPRPRIIAKIEKGEALENFIEILKLADAIMIARGDLGVETPAEDVPLRQKEIVALCRQAAKPVIVATQMLDSMIRNPRPTRAEVSDVANAVMDNVDAVMLSGETATGKYPVPAVQEMNKIILETEESPYDDTEVRDGKGEAEALGESINILIRDSGITQIIDASGGDAYRYISQGRPEADIFARTDEHNLYPLLFWGVVPFSYSKNIIAYLRKKGFLKKKKYILIEKTGEISVKN